MLKRLSLFVILILLVAACSPAATPTTAPQPSAAPAPTTAPRPTGVAPSAAFTPAPSIATALPNVKPPTSGGGVVPPTLPPKSSGSQPNSAKPIKGWQQLGSIQIPTARYDHILIGTDSFNRLVLFGGRSITATLNDTWIYDLAANAWHQITGSIAPEARYGLAGAFDPVNQRILIFGGQNGAKFFNDVWAFDIVKEQWSQIKTAGKAPTGRSDTAAAIDPSLGQFIISRGTTASGLADDTWALDLVTNVWQNISPPTRSPALSHAAATFDEIDHRFILFGGLDANNQPSNDQWSLDPAAQVWKQFGTITPANPTPRSSATIVYDPNTFNIYLFGGKTILGINNETWSIDINNYWTQFNFTTTPIGRSNHAATWDSTNDRMLIFGGLDANNKPLNDLWAFTP